MHPSPVQARRRHDARATTGRRQREDAEEDERRVVPLGFVFL